MVTVSSSSPYHQHSSPFSLSLLLEQHHCNQCVPSSPSLSPFLRQHGALAQKLLQPTTTSSRAGNSPAPAQVPDLALQRETSSNTASSGSRAIYSGSPLLRQILRVGRKRQHEGEGNSPLSVSAGGSPSPGLSPLGSSSKRARIDSPASRVPNSVIIVERKQTYYKKARGMEQVVPNSMISPLERGWKVPSGSGVEGSSRIEEGGSDGSGCQRRLPTNKEGVKPLDLFSGDEIFPNHNEE